MLNIGDVVICVKGDDFIIKGDKYIVRHISSYNSDLILLKGVPYVIPTEYIMSIKEQRRLKLKEICSK